MTAARPTPHRVVALLIVTSIAFIAADRHDPTTFTAARRSALSATDRLRDGLDVLRDPAVGAWAGARGYDRWLEENQRLRARLDELEGDRGRQSDLEAELRRLLAATEIDFVDDLDRVTARVVVDRVTASDHVIELDKGTRHGVRAGMPVVTGTGLVGVIDVATADRALVEPITASGVHVGVRSSADYGVASGQGRGRELSVDLDPRWGSTAPVGARFVTAGLDRSLYPPNIPVGRVAASTPGSAELAPLVDFDRLGYVSVLLWRARP